MLEPDMVEQGAEWAWWSLLEPTEEAAGHLVLSSLDALIGRSPGTLWGEPVLSFHGRWDPWICGGDSCKNEGLSASIWGRLALLTAAGRAHLPLEGLNWPALLVSILSTSCAGTLCWATGQAEKVTLCLMSF